MSNHCHGSLWKRGLQVATLGLTMYGALWAGSARADTIKLKNGRTLTGIIDLASSDEAKVVITTSVGVLKVPRVKIAEVTKLAQVSHTEASGDMAAAENQPDRALELFKKALINEPGNERLKKKVEKLSQQIQARDRYRYGNTFERVEQAIAAQQFDNALKEAEDVLGRIKEESARQHCKALLAQAHVGLARRSREFVAYAEAERQYNLALESDPEGPTAPLELAEMLQASPARKHTAIELYEKGIALAAKRPGVIGANQLLDDRFRLGLMYMSEKRFADSADILLDVAREDSSSRHPEAMETAIEAYSKVQAASLTKNLNRIVANLKLIIKAKPNETRAYLLLGRINYDNKDLAGAREALKAAVDNVPEGALTVPVQKGMLLLGLTYRRLGERELAALTLQKLISARAGNYDALCELAEIRVDQAAYTEAANLFEQAIAQDKDKYRALLGKGTALVKKAQYDDGRACFTQVIKRDPENAPVQMAIARSYAAEEKWDDVSKESLKVIDLLQTKEDGGKIKDKDGKTTATTTVAASADKDTSATAAKGTKVKLTDEEKAIMAEALTLSGKADKQLGKSNQARDSFEQALKYAADYAPALDGIGQTYQTDGLQMDAQKFFNRAIAADPTNPDYYLSLAINWHKYKKNTDKALPLYQKYVELGGKDPKVKDWIKECSAASATTKKS